jgi:hypothetical protein
MSARILVISCFAALVAVVAGWQAVSTRAAISSAQIKSDASLVRLAQEDQSDSTTQSPNNSDSDDSSDSSPPAQNPQ